MKRLNELYAYNAMWYWCNAAGDINSPGVSDKLSGHGSEDDLPAKALDLYKTAWRETGKTNCYVVCVEGKYGIALGYLLDYPDQANMTADDYFEFHNSAMSIAETIERQMNAFYPDVQVLFGTDTDPEGDEIVVFIPYHMKDYVDTIDDFIDNLHIFDPDNEDIRIVDGWVDPITRCKFSIFVNHYGEISVEKIKPCEGSYEDGTVVVKKLSPDDVRHMVLKYLKA